MKGIHKAIVNTMKAVGAVGKGGINSQQKYKYRSIDDVYNALQPAMVKAGMFIVPEIIERDEISLNKGYKVRLTVKYHLMAEDGSSIETVVQGEATDYSDKATNKAMTAAFKYMVIQVFCLAVEGNPDADAESPEYTKPTKKPEPKKVVADTQKQKNKVLSYVFEMVTEAGHTVDYIYDHMFALFKTRDTKSISLSQAQELMKSIESKI